jgi:hypothetical protein
LVQVSLLAGFGTFFSGIGLGPCFQLAGGLCKYYAKPEENNDEASTALSAMQAASSKPIQFYQ